MKVRQLDENLVLRITEEGNYVRMETSADRNEYRIG